MMYELMTAKVMRWTMLIVRMMLGLMMVKLERRLPTVISWPRRRRLVPIIQRRRKICVGGN